MSLYDCKVLGSSDIEIYFNRAALLGRGGYGEVYLANTTDLARGEIGADLPPQVAIKRLNLKGVDTFTRDSIINELTSLKTLNLRYCLKYYGCFENNDHLYIVMEYIQGKDLFDHIVAGTFGEDEKLIVARDIALGIEELHTAGFVHRDIKPENIMVVMDPTIRVVLVDYAFVCNSKQPWSGCSTKMGTRAYYDKKSTPGDIDSMKLADWWAFGQTLVVLFLRKQLFDAGGKKFYPLSDSDISRLPSSVRDLVVNLTNRRIEQIDRPTAREILTVLHDAVNAHGAISM